MALRHSDKYETRGFYCCTKYWSRSSFDYIWFSYLYTVIVLISHNDSSLTVTCYPSWTIKLTGPRTQRPKLMVEGTTGLEYLEREGEHFFNVYIKNHHNE